jgi:hypothetical protein
LPEPQLGRPVVVLLSDPDARAQALAENYQGLESVNLVCCSKVTDAGVQALAEHCPSLKSVNLWWCASTL